MPKDILEDLAERLYTTMVHLYLPQSIAWTDLNGRTRDDYRAMATEALKAAGEVVAAVTDERTTQLTNPNSWRKDLTSARINEAVEMHERIMRALGQPT